MTTIGITRKLPEPYDVMVTAYLDGHLKPANFQQSFLTQFKAEKQQFPEQTYEVLQEIFGHADAFVSDPDLREGLRKEGAPGWYLDEHQLRTLVIDCVSRFKQV